MADNVVEVIIRAKDEASKNLAQLSDSTKAFGIGLASVAAVATAALTGLYAATAQAAERMSDFGAMAAKTGATAEDLSQLAYAAGQSETSIEAVAGSLRSLNRARYEATTGNKDAVASFGRVGISLKDLRNNTLTATDLLRKMADGFNAIPTQAGRVAVALQLLGKNGLSLANLLAEGSAGIEDLMETADRMGLTVTKAAAVVASQFTNAVKTLQAQVDATKQAIATALLPTLIELARAIEPVLLRLTDWIRQNPALVRGIFITAAQLLALTSALAAVASGLWVAKAAVAALTPVLARFGIVAAAAGGWATAIAVVVAALGGLLLYWNTLQEKAKEPLRFKFEVVGDPEQWGVEISRLEQRRKDIQKQFDAIDAERRAAIEKQRKVESTSIFGQKLSDNALAWFSSFPVEKHAEWSRLRDMLKTINAEIQRASDAGKAMSKALKAPTDDGSLDATKTNLKELREEFERILKLNPGVVTKEMAENMFRLSPDNASKMVLAMRDAFLVSRPMSLWFFELDPKSAPQLMRDIQKALAFEKPLEIRVTTKVEEWAEDARKKVGEAAKKQVDQPDLPVPPLISGDAEARAAELDQIFKQMGIDVDALYRKLEEANAQLDSMRGYAILAGEAIGAVLRDRLDPVKNLLYDVTSATQEAMDTIDEAWKTMFRNIFEEGQRVTSALKDFLLTLGNALKRLAIDIMAAVVKAFILKAIFGGAPVPLPVPGGGPNIFAREGGTVLGGRSIAGMARFAAGGTAEPLRALRAAPSPLLRAASGMYVVPGAPQAQDSVLTMLTAPGEAIILPTVGGAKPASLLGALAQIPSAVAAALNNAGSRGGFSQTINVKTFDAHSMMQAIRTGQFANEWALAEEMGRV